MQPPDSNNRFPESTRDDQEKTVRVNTCNSCGYTGLGIICPRDGTTLTLVHEYSSTSFSGNYQLLSEIGSGGMGLVYKAKHLALNRLVAIKMMHAHKLQGPSVRRFQQEAQAVSHLNHPNIVMVHDFGVDNDGLPYMVLDYIDGKSLADLIKKSGPVPLQKSLGIFLQICEGMEHAHANGVLHRDLKPQNIMLTEHSEKVSSVKIVDFGIAKIMDMENTAVGLTQTGEVFGSPPYMSPEQVHGTKTDQRSDIYSLGCLMFETLTGAPPFVAESAISTLMKHTVEAAPTLREGSLGKKFPVAVEAMVAKCLEKDPLKRYQSAAELKLDLSSLMRGDDIAARSQPPAEGKRPISKIVIIGAITIFALIPIAFFGWTSLRHSQRKASAEDTQANNPDKEAVQPTKPESTDNLSSPSPQYATGTKKNPSTDVSSMDETVADFAATERSQEKVRLLSSMTDEMLRKQDFAAAKEIDGNNTLICGTGFGSLKDSGNLTHLSLENTPLRDAGLKEIGKLHSLTSLDIAHANMTKPRNHITDAGLAPLQHLSHLEILNVNDAGPSEEISSDRLPREKHIGDEGLAYLGKLNSLKNLDITKANVTARGIENLSAAPIEILTMNYTPLKDYSCLRKLKRLYSLTIVSPLTETEQQMSDLANLQLEKLDISQARINNAGLQKLAHSKKLRTLILHSCANLTSADVKELKSTLADDVVIEFYRSKSAGNVPQVDPYFSKTDAAKK